MILLRGALFVADWGNGDVLVGKKCCVYGIFFLNRVVCSMTPAVLGRRLDLRTRKVLLMSVSGEESAEFIV